MLRKLLSKSREMGRITNCRTCSSCDGLLDSEHACQSSSFGRRCGRAIPESFEYRSRTPEDGLQNCASMHGNLQPWPPSRPAPPTSWLVDLRNHAGDAAVRYRNPCRGIGSVRETPSAIPYVSFEERAHQQAMTLEGFLCGFRKHRQSVFAALPISDDDLVPQEIQILHPHRQRIVRSSELRNGLEKEHFKQHFLLIVLSTLAALLSSRKAA